MRTALPAGHVLVDGDLATAQAKLDDAASSHYYRSGSRAALVGRPLTAAVGAGALLPADAVAPAAASESRVVPVVVHAGRLPELHPGDHVDVYALVKGPTGGGGAGTGDQEVLIVRDVEFLSGETLGNGDTSAAVRVAVPDAIRVVAASQSERVDLVRVDGATAGSAAPVPTSVPGLGS